MARLRFLLILSILTLITVSACIKRVERQTKIDFNRYFPLQEGNEFVYSGLHEKAIVTGGFGDLFTITYFDSTDNIIRREDYLLKETGVRYKGQFFNDTAGVSKFYEPSLPFGPWSNLIGDTLLVGSVEIRCDLNYTHLPIIAEYRIVAIESIEIPAGEFDDCIKIRRLIKSTGNIKSRTVDEESFWWFAPDVGLVRSEIPQGNRELIRAVIDGVTYPHP